MWDWSAPSGTGSQIKDYRSKQRQRAWRLYSIYQYECPDYEDCPVDNDTRNLECVKCDVIIWCVILSHNWAIYPAHWICESQRNQQHSKPMMTWPCWVGLFNPWQHTLADKQHFNTRRKDEEMRRSRWADEKRKKSIIDSSSVQQEKHSAAWFFLSIRPCVCCTSLW